MKPVILAFTVAVITAAIGWADVASAKDINHREFLPPGARAKVNTFMAQSWRQRAEGNEAMRSRRSDTVTCGSQQVGNVKVQPGQRAPREVITAIQGDVINLANCR